MIKLKMDQVNKLVEENLKNSLNLDLSEGYVDYLFNDDNSNDKYLRTIIAYNFEQEFLDIYKPIRNNLQLLDRFDPYSYYYSLRDIFNITGVIIKESTNGFYIDNIESITNVLKLKSNVTKYEQTNNNYNNNDDIY